MARIPRALLDGLTRAINSLSGAAAESVEDAVLGAAASLAGPDGLVPSGRVAELRDAAASALDAACSGACGSSAALAAAFYDAVRAEAGVASRFSASADGARSPEATEAAVRALVQSVADTGDASSFARSVAARADYEVKRSAGECVLRNALRDPAKPRYARVPSGSETCGFCIMLASRGFVYRSAKTAGQAGHYHANCDCRIVPGFEGAESVEGYDPEWYRKVYEDASATCGSDDVRDIVREIETRSSRWVNGGENGKAVYLKPLEHFTGTEGIRDIFAHDSLTAHGFDITVRREDAPDGFSNIDLSISGALWEVKSPSSSSTRSIESNLRRAKSQFENPFVLDGESASKIRVVFNSMYMALEDDAVSSKLVVEMKRHGIHEVIHVRKDGGIRRFTNG